MKCKVVRNRITIPAEIRDRANLKDGDFLDVNLDGKTKNIIMSILDRGESVSKDKNVEKIKKTSKKVDSKVKSNCKKIEANYMDADKLYKAYYSECGLLVRTKNSYVRNACEKCQGKLAEEYEDRLDVHCSYLSKKINKEPDNSIKSKKVDLKDIKKQRKSDKANISNNVKKAVKVIDKKISNLSKQVKPKICTSDSTTIKPIRAGKDILLKCIECGQLVKSGFLIDNNILCKECTTDDFKKYMKKRGK